MKLMSYNILDGAVNTLPQIIRIVKEQNPDYLTLNEANTFVKDNNRILKEFSKETSLQYFDIALSGEFDYHVAVFSKYPFKKVHKIQPLARACLISVIDTKLGEISIASLHLTPFSEDMRHPEIDSVLDFQKPYKSRILMGDMNSLSKYDQYSSSMMSNFNETQIRKFTTNGKLRFDAIDKILSLGYYDSALELGKNKDFTVPTRSNRDLAHSQMRLDYIFLSESLLPHLQTYSVIKNDLTETSSDHYPITVELQ